MKDIVYKKKYAAVWADQELKQVGIEMLTPVSDAVYFITRSDKFQETVFKKCPNGIYECMTKKNYGRLGENKLVALQTYNQVINGITNKVIGKIIQQKPKLKGPIKQAAEEHEEAWNTVKKCATKIEDDAVMEEFRYFINGIENT